MNSIDFGPKIKVVDVAFFIWTDGQIGGQERRYLRLANYMADFMQVKVAIIVQARAFDTLSKNFYFSENLQVVTFGTFDFKSKSPSGAIKELISLRKALASNTITNFHVCTNPSYMSAILPFFLGDNIKFVSQSMADYTFDEGIGRLKRFVIGLSINRYSLIDCLSPMTKVVFKKVFSNYRGILAVAPNSFTDLTKIVTSEKRDIDVVFVSRLVDQKGVDLLVDLVKTSSYQVKVLGFGPLSNTIDPQYLVPSNTNPFELLSRSKVFLSLQPGNNYPSQSLIEAMASGCAIVATDVGETRELLDDENSILIKYDLDQLCCAIDLLLNDPVKRLELSNNAINTVNRSQTIEKYCSYLISAFNGVAR